MAPPKKESLQRKLDRVRPPRVQITYEVHVGDAMEIRDLPFVVGILGDFSGKPSEPLPPLKDRPLIEIDRDNFNDVLRGMKPRLAFRVDDKLTGKADAQLGVELNFNNLDDFSPESVVQQVEPMRKLLETRNQLKDLLSNLDGNDKLSEVFDQIIANTESRSALARQLNVGEEPKGGNSEPAG